MSDPLAPFAGDHEAHIYAVKEPPYVIGKGVPRPIYPELLTIAVMTKFWSRIRVDENSCHIFDGTTSRDGYGQMYVPGIGNAYVHRVAWTYANGSLTPGMVLDHLCRNRVCCNPQHLEEVTQRENILRGESPSAIAVRTGYCAAGHLREPGREKCRQCERAGERRRRKEVREALGLTPKTPAGQCRRGHDLTAPRALTVEKRPRCRECQNANARERRAKRATRPQETP